MSQTKGRFLLGFTVLFLSLQFLATALAIYGQRIAYFIWDFIGLYGPIVLTIVTFLSIGTFISTYIVILRAEKKRPDISFFIFLMINGLYGFIVSLVALFVLAMWWG
ncbi:hypothetical protein ACFOZY_00555 [Chungangia koreensis]|uniref:Uncharacterized protein n=1 Tax=Chungangia koreensis TaxID=752657 RepID=A0ABV8X097_9LACT